MNKYRSAALALAACAASLSMAACSAGTPSASSAGTPTASAGGTAAGGASSAASNQSAAPAITSAVPTTGAPIASRMISVNGKLSNFPVPAAAKVGENIGGGSALVVVFGGLAPADVARFYATALPRAGYTVSTNALLTKNGESGALIEFSGHGYKGNIDSLNQFPGGTVAGLGSTNVTTIVFSPTK
jgi:hypothetical protein